MKLVKAKGQMYDWVTHMWNPIIGCSHQCSYCYVKHFREQPAALKLCKPFPKLGHGKKIFVGHLTDLFANDVPDKWIISVLETCKNYDNEYIFQTKNPSRAMFYHPHFPDKILFGTTIETNNYEMLKDISTAPSVYNRASYLRLLKDTYEIKTFLTIEPIMDFMLGNMIYLIQLAHPDFINIGADSKGHNLPEPSKEKVKALIAGINKLGIEIREKTNLERLKISGK